MSVHSGGNIAAVLDRPTQARPKILILFLQFGPKPTESKAIPSLDSWTNSSKYHSPPLSVRYNRDYLGPNRSTRCFIHGIPSHLHRAMEESVRKDYFAKVLMLRSIFSGTIRCGTSITHFSFYSAQLLFCSPHCQSKLAFIYLRLPDYFDHIAQPPLLGPLARF